MKNIIVEEKVETIATENFIYEIDLHDIVSTKYDIKGIYIELSNNISYIEICLAGSIVARFNHTTINNLSTYQIYLSLMFYCKAQMNIIYDKEWIKQNSIFYDTKNIIESIEFGDDCEIFDGDKFIVGKLVKRKLISTNVQKSCCNIIIPKFVIKIEETNKLIDKIEYTSNDNINGNTIVYFQGMVGSKYCL